MTRDAVLTSGQPLPTGTVTFLRTDVEGSMRLVRELGTRWDIARNYFRLYACCNPIHPALDALDEVLAELGEPAAEDIERIEAATYRFASVMRNPEPPNFFGSKYSLPHAAAVRVVRGSLDHAALDDTALQDPRIARLRTRVAVTEDPAMTAAAPVLVLFSARALSAARRAAA